MTRTLTVVIPAVVALPIAAWVVGSCALVWVALYVGHQVRRVAGAVA